MVSSRPYPYQIAECDAMVALKQKKKISIELLGVSPDTVLRDWKLAKTWLARKMKKYRISNHLSQADAEPIETDF